MVWHELIPIKGGILMEKDVRCKALKILSKIVLYAITVVGCDLEFIHSFIFN